MEDLLTCCNHIEDCCSLINESYQEINKQQREENGDFPFTMVRHFQLLPEFDIQKTRFDAMEAVDPLVSKIETKIEQMISSLERERATLQQTFELYKLRGSNNSGGGGGDVADDAATAGTRSSTRHSNVIMTSSTPEELERLRSLRLTKESLLKQIEDSNARYR